MNKCFFGSYSWLLKNKSKVKHLIFVKDPLVGEPIEKEFLSSFESHLMIFVPMSHSCAPSHRDVQRAILFAKGKDNVAIIHQEKMSHKILVKMYEIVRTHMEIKT
jgi:hypothetical protein